MWWVEWMNVLHGINALDMIYGCGYIGMTTLKRIYRSDWVSSANAAPLTCDSCDGCDAAACCHYVTLWMRVLPPWLVLIDVGGGGGMGCCWGWSVMDEDEIIFSDALRYFVLYDENILNMSSRKKDSIVTGQSCHYKTIQLQHIKLSYSTTK